MEGEVTEKEIAVGDTNAAQLPEHKIDISPSSTDEDANNDDGKKSSKKSKKPKKKEKDGEDDGKNEDEDGTTGSLSDYFRIFRYTAPIDRLLYLLAFLCQIGAGITSPLVAVVFGRFTSQITDFVTGNGSQSAFQSTVNQLALYFVYLAIARFCLVYIGTLVINIAAIRTVRAFRVAFLEHTLRQEVWHFDKQDNGSTATQVTTNGNRINQGIAEKLGLLVQGLSLFFSAFIVALTVQWKLSLIVMSIIPANAIVFAICIYFVVKNESRVTKMYSAAAVIAQDALSSIRTIHAFTAQDKVVKRYDEKLESALHHALKQSPFFGLIYGGPNFLMLSGIALAFWQGYRMFRSGEVPDVGKVTTVILSVTLGATSMMTIAPQMQAITSATAAAAELFEVIDKKSELDPLAPEGLQPSEFNGEIVIRDLEFSYPSRPSAKVLNGLNLHLPAGKTTALVGASGSGKSTVVGLLERWYLPSAGEILLDGTSINDYNVQWLRERVRLVQQEPTLFSGTVYENVVKGLVGPQLELSEEKKMELVVQSCKDSNAHDFITELPDGYNTQVGERASMLSGGQKQRVAIARSIISDPKILLLDEATSALDPRAEKVVQDALDRVSAHKTTLVIAHKLATVKAADSIAVMSKGVVVEQGTHAELIAAGGQYAQMVSSQDLGEAGEGDGHDSQEDEEESDDNALTAQTSALQRTRTEASTAAAAKEEVKHLTAESAGYSLPRSIYIMLGEQRDLYWLMVIAAFCSLIAGGAYPAQAIIFSHLINVFTDVGPNGQSGANFWALMFFVLALTNLLAYFLIGVTANYMGQISTRRYRKEMFQRMLYFDQDFFDRPENASGALTSKLSSMPTALQELISGNLILILVVIVNVVASSAVGIAFGWRLGLTIVFSGMPTLVASGYYRIHLEQHLEEKTNNRFAASAGLATEAVSSIRTVSSLTLEGPIMREYADSLEGIVRNSIRGLCLTLIPYALSQSLEYCIQALAFWYGTRLLAQGEYTLTQFFIIFLAVLFGGQAAGEFFGYTTSITKARTAANYILWLRTIEAKIGETEQNKDVGPSSGDSAVKLDQVKFAYIQRAAAKVLRGVDIDIKPGQSVAVVGPSGSGKSTIVALLERFYDPTSGTITLNHQDVRELSPRLYRNHIGMVEQQPPLYQNSIRENISLGLPHEPTEEELTEACRQANALEFISSLPEGLNTNCGSKGLQFSGGQRQRIAVARALIRNPRLLLLDEATSALDTQSEKIVQKALEEAAATRTTIAVAHRLSTIRNCDVIFVLADGKVAEVGSHEELQALRGRYYKMCLAQSLDQDQS